MGGRLAVNKRVVKYVEKGNTITGISLVPDDAYSVIRGLRTRDERVKRRWERERTGEGLM